MTAFLYSWPVLHFSLERHCVIILLIYGVGFQLMVQRAAEMFHRSFFLGSWRRSGITAQRATLALSVAYTIFTFNNSRLKHQTHTHLVQIRYAWRPHCKKWQRLIVSGRFLDIFQQTWQQQLEQKNVCEQSSWIQFEDQAVRLRLNQHAPFLGSILN